MKLGPNSPNAAASRWPGRGATRVRRRRRARPIRKRGAKPGTASSGKSASCRAKIRPIRVNRARLRALRTSPNSGRSTSETPSRMERSDAPREVAKPHLIEPRARNHFAKLALSRETPNAFHEIGVSLSIAGHDPAEQRHDIEAVKIV